MLEQIRKLSMALAAAARLAPVTPTPTACARRAAQEPRSEQQSPVDVLLRLSTPELRLTIQIRFSRSQSPAEREELDEEFFFHPLQSLGFYLVHSLFQQGDPNHCPENKRGPLTIR